MSYKFFQNTKCEYFPCHKGIDKEDFNCLFCYCPLYGLCDGDYKYLDNGVKDCSNCSFPHKRENYCNVLNKLYYNSVIKKD